MRKLLSIIVIFLICTSAFAGFGRGGSSGSSARSFSSSSSFRSNSYSRSQSAPRQTTIIREHHYAPKYSPLVPQSGQAGMGFGQTMLATGLGSAAGNVLGNMINGHGAASNNSMPTQSYSPPLSQPSQQAGGSDTITQPTLPNVTQAIAANDELKPSTRAMLFFLLGLCATSLIGLLTCVFHINKYK